MKSIGLKIMLSGGHFLTSLVTVETAAQVLTWFKEEKFPGRTLHGKDVIQGVPWEWACNVKDIVGVHTFVPQQVGQPGMTGPLGSGLN